MHRFHHPALASVIKSRNGGPAEPLSDVVLELEKEESHHAAKVLRLVAGNEVGVFDGNGTMAQGVIERAAPRVTIRLVSVQRVEAASPRIDVAVAIPKGSRADAMIEQLSQAGCDVLIPLRTRRSVVDPRDAKLERFARAAIESAKQCGRSHVMAIRPIADMTPAFWKEPHDLRLIASPAGSSNQVLDDRIRAARHLLILIGPEGGWSEEELTAAAAAGCQPWCLGPHVMRIETAAAAAVVIARHLTQPQG